jgi:hypothetical protein
MYVQSTSRASQLLLYVCEKGSLKFQELIQTRLIKIKILSGRCDKDHESRAAVTAGVFNFYNTHSIFRYRSTQRQRRRRRVSLFSLVG